MSEADAESRQAFHDLIEAMREVDARFVSPEFGLSSAQDVADGLRAVMHVLQGALFSHLEDDPDRPVFRRIVSPTRKLLGDNPNAIYYDAPVRAGRVYKIRGNISGAVYVSLTVGCEGDEGRFGGRTAGLINDTDFDVDADGNFELVLGGEARPRNWLELPDDAARIVSRHYFEEQENVAADLTRQVPMQIETLERLPAPATPHDDSVAASIRRVSNFLRTNTLGLGAPGERQLPAFVSTDPNHFNPPVKPGDFALAAADAAYTMAPYVLGPEEALVMTGRWPQCRCANVALWNRHLQTFDYVNRRVSLNRKQTEVLPDGSFRMVIAHRDPGVANWIDTEERPFGMVFWRYMLPQGEIETPRTEVVSLEALLG